MSLLRVAGTFDIGVLAYAAAMLLSPSLWQFSDGPCMSALQGTPDCP